MSTQRLTLQRPDDIEGAVLCAKPHAHSNRCQLSAAHVDLDATFIGQSSFVVIHTTELARSASCHGVVRPDWSQLSCKWLPDRQIALLSSYVPNAVTAVEVLVQGRPVVVSVASQLLYDGAPLVADVAKGRRVSVLRYPALMSALFDFRHRLFLANATALLCPA